MSDDINVRPLGPGESVELDQFWRCPSCGCSMAGGKPVKLSPPKCAMGHSPTEMEQVTSQAFSKDLPS